jgi:hypothetical protein
MKEETTNLELTKSELNAVGNLVHASLKAMTDANLNELDNKRRKEVVQIMLGGLTAMMKLGKAMDALKEREARAAVSAAEEAAHA